MMAMCCKMDLGEAIGSREQGAFEQAGVRKDRKIYHTVSNGDPGAGRSARRGLEHSIWQVLKWELRAGRYLHKRFHYGHHGSSSASKSLYTIHNEEKEYVIRQEPPRLHTR
jgi:hypothetical protein